MAGTGDKLTASFVTPWYGEKIPGGAEAEARRTAQNLAAAGVEVRVITTCLSGLGSNWDEDHYPPGETVEDGVTVLRFASQARDGGRFNTLNARVMSGESLTPAEERDFFANMVHSPGLLEHLAAHPEQGPFFFIPYLFTTSAWGPLVHPSRSVIIPCLHDEGYARMASVRRAMEASRAIVFHVPAERDLAASLYDLDKTEPLVLGEGVDSEWTHDAARFRAKYDMPGPFILYAGRKDAGKNVPLLSQYFLRYLQDGGGPEGLKLVMIGNLPAPIPPGGEEHIIDLGFVSKQDKYDAYAAASVLVQPSVMESFSLVIMESWLAGVPVMVHGGCAVTKEHALTSGGGLAFSDYPHFAEGLRLLLGNDDLRQEMGRRGREYVLSNYSWPVVTQRFTELIERLHQEPVPAPTKVPQDLAPPASSLARGVKSRGGVAAAKAGDGPAVHQLLPDFAYGDAIGNDVLAIQKALRSWGFRSEIFAQHVHPRLRSRALPVGDYPGQAKPEDVLLFHFSIGHPLADQVADLPGRLVVRYHNITPAQFLEELYPDAAERSRLGREQLPRLAQAAELGIGVSGYNTGELTEAGCPNAATVPILLNLDQLALAPDPRVFSRFGRGGPNLLHVGRIVPNKAIEDLIKTQYWLAKLIPGARLMIVGGGDMSPYGLGLRELVRDLRVPGVHFSGHVSDHELMAYYRSAQLYLCMSRHEGFCVPLVESMHFGIPVVALARTGVPGTLGDAGLLLKEADHPLAAEAAARVLSEPDLADSLARRGRERLKRFQADKVAGELKQVLADRLGLEPPA